jgi:microcystin-dependent protein
MSDPFLGQISITAFAFAPKGWALCNGQLLSINQNQALFSLLGTQYGGDGRVTFALPDLRGRAAVHAGGGVPPGQRAGAEWVALNVSQMPSHSHALKATSDLANASVPGNALPAARARGGPTMYASGTGGQAVAMHPDTVAAAGGSQPHDNMQPYGVLSFVIALQGIFPSRD